MSELDQEDLAALVGDWNYPTAISFGVGRIKLLGQYCGELGMSRPLIVTDKGLAELEWVGELVEGCRAGGLAAAVFAEVKSNPTGTNVDEGVISYRNGGHDGVVALGGGSALDAAKAIALMVGQDRSIWEFEDIGDNWKRVNAAGMAPTIAIPTTAGTGSEVGRASVIVDESCQRKKIIFHPQMLPAKVIADPQLTQGLPAHITAATGMDALVHNLEAYCAPGYHPMADGIAVEAIRLIARWLPVAVRDGDNLIARSHMLVASTMGATAFQKGLGGVHALAHPLGAIYDKHHGLLNAILLPYVLERNRAAIAARIAQLSRCLSLEPSFDAFSKWLVELRHGIGIPQTLEKIGIGDERSEEIGELAFQDPCAGGNPILMDAGDYATLFRQAVGRGL